MYYVYLLRCKKDNSLYCGITNDLAAREKAHNAGTGSKYVFSHGGGTIVYAEQLETKSEALQREAAIKKLSKQQKEQLVATA
jgi:putative endonuclease